MLYLFLDRGQTNSIDNNLPFFAEPGNIKIETTLKLSLITFYLKKFYAKIRPSNPIFVMTISSFCNLEFF